jgi:predicted porin
VKRTFISAAAILAFTAAGHADELTDIQAQAKQLREQNAAMTKRLADLEKRQKSLETQKAAVPTINPVDALAADLPYKAAVKAKAVENDDICIHGICLYGNFDAGIQYNQHGNTYANLAAGPTQTLLEKASNGSYFGFGGNQLSTSFLGLRGKQEICDNLYAVFNLQTLFNPGSGANGNGVGSIVQNNCLGSPAALGNLTNAYGDSSKAGQLFNNAAYFGISSPTYGTVTVGRQTALSSDNVVNYDALAGANNWSLITFEGATAGGGATENRNYDNSIEYRVNVGPVRFALETQLRGGTNTTTQNAFEGDVGFDYQGLSVDFLGGKINNANAVGTTLTQAQVNQLTANQLGTNTTLAYAIPCALGCLSGTVSDDTVFQIFAKYTIGAWKIYGGYEHIQFANPNNPLLPGAFTPGGYNLAFVNNNQYLTDRNQHVFWIGAKYAITPTLDIAASYYGIRQESFTVGGGAAANTFFNVPGTAPGFIAGGLTQAAACAQNSAVSAGCSGAVDQFGLVVDWRFARHVDFYAGIGYTQKSGGLLATFATSNNNTVIGGNSAALLGVNSRASTYTPGAGIRYQF